MFTKLSLVISILIIFQSELLLAQKNYKPGIIVTLSGDTCKGYINTKSNINSSKICEFKQDETNIERYHPEDILAYRIENNKFYVSKEIPLNGSTEFVFLEFLVDGIVDLYYYKNLKSEYYFIEKEGELFELSNNEIVAMNGDNRYVKNSNQYVGMLKYLFSDSPTAIDKVNNTNFNYPSLINITKAYHNDVCTTYECIDFTKTQIKTKIFAEPYTGIKSSRMRFKNSQDYANGNTATVGMNIRFMPLFNSDHISFMFGINSSTYSYLGKFSDIAGSSGNITYQVKIDYRAVHIPIMLEYALLINKLQPFVWAGFDNIYIIPASESHDVRNFYTVSGNEYLSNPYKTIYRSYHAGFLAGIGTRYFINKNFALNLKISCEYSSPRTKSHEINILDYSYVQSLSVDFGLSYIIKK